MVIYDDKWFEVWSNDGLDVVPTYFLLVTPDPKNVGQIMIVDLLNNNDIVFRGKDYEEVCNWLSEDEYDLVEGRTFPNFYDFGPRTP